MLWGTGADERSVVRPDAERLNAGFAPGRTASNDGRTAVDGDRRNVPCRPAATDPGAAARRAVAGAALRRAVARP